MTINSAIDVAIALVLMYLVLSLIGTVLNEFLATGADLRAANLEAAIRSLIDHPQLLTDFYNNGLIASLNTAVTGGQAPLARGLSGMARWVTRAGPGGDQPHVSYLSGQTFAQALIASVDTTKNLPSFDDVRNAVQNLPDTNIRDALLAQIAAAQGDLNKLRNGVAAWFDAAMQRVSGVYKRHLKQISFCVGVALVLVINADTITVATSLWNDPALRAGMVEAANNFVQKSESSSGAGAATVNSQQAAAGGACANPPQPTPAPAGQSNAKSPVDQQLLIQLHCYEDTLRPLPLGWDLSISSKSGRELAAFIAAKILGLALTAFAISLGAPFWFDLLSMFMRIRGTGDKPEVDPKTGTT